MLIGKSEDASRAKIDSALDQLFYLNKDERTLRNLAEAFGLKKEGSIRQGMERWLKGDSRITSPARKTTWISASNWLLLT